MIKKSIENIYKKWLDFNMNTGYLIKREIEQMSDFFNQVL